MLTVEVREFHDMSKKISCATTVLMDTKDAASEIDRVLNEMLYYSQPGYIGIPTDVCYTSTSSSSLNTPLKIDLPSNDKEIEKMAIADIRKLLEASSKPIIMVDGGAIRNQVLPEVENLLKITDFPYFTNPWGKGCVTEESPRFGGLYVGVASKEDVQAAVESSDCVLWIGNLPSDFNTAEFTEHVKPETVVEFQRHYVSIDGRKVELKMKWLLQGLLADFEENPLKIQHKWDTLPCTPYAEILPAPNGPLTQAWMWSRLTGFLKPKDLLIIETGTSQTGIGDTRFPRDLQMFTQTIFGSIGYAAGASVGAFVAGKEGGKIQRNVLVTGDGSLQLTIQAFSDLLRHDLKPVM